MYVGVGVCACETVTFVEAFSLHCGVKLVSRQRDAKAILEVEIQFISVFQSEKVKLVFYTYEVKYVFLFFCDILL